MKIQKRNGLKKYCLGMLIAAALCMTACAEDAADGGETGTDVESEIITGESEAEEVTQSQSPETEETQIQEEESTEPVILEPDVTPPVLNGVQNLTVEAGSNISYKRGVEVTDDRGECVLEIDTSTVDLNTVGTYEVVYKAIDAAGNETSQTIVVTVVNPTAVTEEQINAMADAIIASVVREDMTQLEVAKALWDWCHTKIRYSYSAGERGLLAGAYEGLNNRSGDCYAYYATYEVLLTRAGIENMCVTRIGGETNHWWNLVNVGDGWYHCDTSPRKWGHKYICFMQTDEQIAAYEAIYAAIDPVRHNYFTFESDLYPERATTIIFESSMP